MSAFDAAWSFLKGEKPGMPAYWGKNKGSEEVKPEKNEIDEDKYASPWARARVKEAAEAAEAAEAKKREDEMANNAVVQP
tara:strand:+ start:149 stop:388 length:240 start_codon:yes stop_codon:yes gene_type:complete